ncbi:Major facilitator superfamily domain, general substrate transporter [Metarhizium rileyi]|uniref:Major facilitator superfamily domain, general substrate transporter n=1 Tax=Metarhizium rileyi (strain RCEF 4871) TaxID=1649241 RepID=A0A167CY87_METRR|nr:Major facilitator superfamily domain, general substrate transporter [Metarhizium rileyi RCEF 4871]
MASFLWDINGAPQYENFLLSYIVPILQVMLEDRLHVEKSQTQVITSLVLSSHAVVSMLTGPFIGHLADKLPNRKFSLLMSLGAEMIGTIVIMISSSVPLLLVGRAIQAIGGNAAWIVGLSTIAATVGQENTGRTLGVTSSFITSGLLFGPMISGKLLQQAGYWTTWMVAIGVLGVDMMMRLVMIEKPHDREKNTSTRISIDDAEAAQTSNPKDIDEQTSLLHTSSSDDRDQTCTEPQSDDNVAALPKSKAAPDTSSHESFYKFIFTNPRALTALACHCTMAVILLSVDTTLPLYASRTFGWDTAQVSLMFLLLQMPSLLFATLIGILKDRVGTRILTGSGFLGMASCIWLLGAAANIGLALDNSVYKGHTIFMMSLVGMGFSRTFISGSGILEMTNVMKDVQEKRPNCFGPNGKMSSAYSLTNFTWNTGMLIGPILSGFLVRTIGYYYMNMVMCAISAVVGTLALIFLGKR